MAVILLAMIGGLEALAAPSRLAEFAAAVEPQEFFPRASRVGAPQGDPPILPVYAQDELLGYVYLNSDITGSVGYSGKPVHMLIGIDPEGMITGFKLVEHKEPIVLVGVPERQVIKALNKLIGAKIGLIASGKERAPQPDIVSGATVTILVMADSVVRSAVRLWRSGRISPNVQDDAIAAQPIGAKSVDMSQDETRDWQTLLGDGSVRRLRLSVGDINQAFEKSAKGEAAAHPEHGDANDTFIDLYAALVSVPAIGKSLLGKVVYERLRERLKPEQQAILIAAEGRYSFKGSGYVRGGIFDRIELEQGGSGIRFRDRNHERLGAIQAAGAPMLPEVGLFTVPEEFRLDPTDPWAIELLVQRATGAREKAFLEFNLPYILPDRYMKIEAAPIPKRDAANPKVTTSEPLTAAGEEPLWRQMWQRNAASVAVTGLAIAVLTGIFFFQNALVRRPIVYTWVRRGFLMFTLVWLGWYANAQLSVVNVLTFTNALLTGFNWEYFLSAPLIFILWSSVAISLLFWGRGPFCGWLCPFGALQELTNSVAKALGVPQLRVAWDLHERLWPIKYVIFLGLFGLSLYSLTAAERLAVVEPFKTAIILKFVREWPFVLFAVALLTAGLFVERFFCRYLCPLGAALALPARLRQFEWLKRHWQCGRECRICEVQCPVQAIQPEGNIHPGECIYCLKCQTNYFNELVCPPMIERRKRRERRAAASRGGSGFPPVSATRKS
jgi:NosR/NirI family nitrous oxide reductase transcriptional regulator